MESGVRPRALAELDLKSLNCRLRDARGPRRTPLARLCTARERCSYQCVPVARPLRKDVGDQPLDEGVRRKGSLSEETPPYGASAPDVVMSGLCTLLPVCP